MVSVIAEDQARERTTTDDATPVQSAATGQVEETGRKMFAGIRGVLTIGAITASSLCTFSTPALAKEHEFIRIPIEWITRDTSVAQALSEITERYESIFFSYPGCVVDIGKNASGDPVSVAVRVSVDGKDTVVTRPIRQFNFEVRPDMRLIVDGVRRGGVKQLTFRPAQPLQLDDEQERLLKDIVSAFRSSSDA